MEILFLTTWVVTGVALAALLTPEPTARFAWAPMACFLGPIWAAVAAERRLRPPFSAAGHRPAVATTTAEPARPAESALR